MFYLSVSPMTSINDDDEDFIISKKRKCSRRGVDENGAKKFKDCDFDSLDNGKKCRIIVNNNRIVIHLIL